MSLTEHKIDEVGFRSILLTMNRPQPDTQEPRLTYLGEPVQLDEDLQEGSRVIDGTRHFSVTDYADAMGKSALVCLQSDSKPDGTGDNPTSEIVANLHVGLLNKNELGMAALGFANDLRDLPNCRIVVCDEDDFSMVNHRLQKDGVTGVSGLPLDEHCANIIAGQMRAMGKVGHPQCVIITPGGYPKKTFMQASLHAHREGLDEIQFPDFPDNALEETPPLT